MTAIPRGTPLQGRHVLAAVLGFFGTIFLVNGIFLYAALSTHTGVVAQEPYRKGLHYNQRIAAAARQDQLGWTADAMLTGETGLTVVVRDAAGAPVSGLFVAGALGRPSTDEHDLRLVLSEVAPGRYAVPIGGLEPGAWLASIEAVWPGSGDAEPVYRMRKRLWLKS
ncbi:MAG: FixH family protein [Hyphomicrobiaceae bacterium]|nr:FixH family protein [Hyphomicrobiaceae bacterium]